MQDNQIKIKSKENLLKDFIEVNRIKYQTPYGETDRIIVENNRAAAVLIHRIDDDKFVLLYQNRVTALIRDQDAWIYEIPTGVFNKDEDGETCIRREALEEAGYRINELELIADVMSSPGYSTEKILIYYARVTSQDKIAKGGGLKEEHEMIEVKEIPVKEVMEMLSKHQFQDAKTVIALQWAFIMMNYEL